MVDYGFDAEALSAIFVPSATGDLLKYNTTTAKFDILAIGTGSQVLRVNSGGTDLEYHTLVAADITDIATATITFTNKTLTDFTNDILADGQHMQVRNESGAAMSIGDVVFVSGYSIGQDLPLVTLADASSSATMPAIGIVSESIANNATGGICVTGRMAAINTSSFTAGDAIYVSETAGALTNVKPTGAALVQNMGTVLRSHATLGVIQIVALNRSNDLPNIASANFWLGNASSVPTAVIMSGDASMDNTGAVTVTIASTDLTDSANLARNTNNLSFFAATTSAQLLGVISDETGTGLLVFNTSPTIVTPTIASFVNATHTHLNAAGGGTITKAAISDFAHQATHQTAGSDALTGNLDATARTSVSKNSTADVGARRTLNFIEGSNVTLTIVDDAAGEEVDITIASSGAGSPLTTKGDIFGFTTVDARIPVGTNNQVLMADSVQALGVKYALVADANITAHTSTKITITAKGQLNSNIVYTDQANTFGAFAQVFPNTQLQVNNPANTFQYIFGSAAIVADRTVSLPLLTGNDTFVFNAFAATLTNKTIDADNNTVSNIGSAEIKSEIITGLATVTAASGDFILISDTGDAGNLKKVDAADFLGGTSLPVADTTSIAEGSVDATKEVRFEVDGNTTGIIGVLATIFTTAKTVTFPNATDTLVGKATTDVFTNKSYDLGGTGNVLTGSLAEFNTALQSDTFATLANTVTITNKTFDNTNSFNGFFDVAEIATPASPAANTARLFAADVGGNTHIFQDNSTEAPIDLTTGAEVTTWTANHDAAGFDLLNVGAIQINNPADTFQYIITPSAIVADRTITLPLQTGNAEFMLTEGSPDQTVISIKNFSTGTLRIWNATKTFAFAFVSTAIAATRSIELPLLTGDDTFVFEAFAQTLTNKTIALGSNTVSGTFAQFNTAVTDATLVDLDDTQTLSNKTLDNTNSFSGFFDVTEIATPASPAANTARLFAADVGGNTHIFQDNSTEAPIDLTTGSETTTWTANHDAAGFDLLNVGGIQINNPADTFQYIVTPAAIIADRILNLPLLTGTDTVVVTSLAQTLLNKTFASVTFSSTITINDGIKFTFNPSTTVAGINVGSVTANPSAPVNGDIWYNSTTIALTAQVDGSPIGLIGDSSVDTLTNKTFDLGGTGNVLTGSVAEFNTALQGDSFAVISNNLSVFAATTSAQLAGVISDETGTGLLVFGTSPTLITPALGTPASGVMTNMTGLVNAGVAAGAAIAYSKLNLTASIVDGDMLATGDAMLVGLEFIIDGGGSAITTGIKGCIEVPFNCTIERQTTLADQTGSIVLDIWKDTFANFPPTVADTITASAKPTITSAVKDQDSTLTGWTTALSEGDILYFNVDSITTVQRVLISLKVRKT